MKKIVLGAGIVAAIITIVVLITSQKEKASIVHSPIVPFMGEDGTYCFTYQHAATPEAPYEVTEHMFIDLSHNTINGTKVGMQSGPDMTNGYEGTITGQKEADTITAKFAYTVEGSQNIEVEKYAIGATGLKKHRYTLVEKNGMLIPNTSTAFTEQSYVSVDCPATH